MPQTSDGEIGCCTVSSRFQSLKERIKGMHMLNVPLLLIITDLMDRSFGLRSTSKTRGFVLVLSLPLAHRKRNIFVGRCQNIPIISSQFYSSLFLRLSVCWVGTSFFLFCGRVFAGRSAPWPTRLDRQQPTTSHPRSVRARARVCRLCVRGVVARVGSSAGESPFKSLFPLARSRHQTSTSEREAKTRGAPPNEAHQPTPVRPESGCVPGVGRGCGVVGRSSASGDVTQRLRADRVKGDQRATAHTSDERATRRQVEHDEPSTHTVACTRCRLCGRRTDDADHGGTVKNGRNEHTPDRLARQGVTTR